tara:strand:- start:679 stop:1818 length:1140 start_codon:yes stop_codon:yes gene_type:complete
MLEQRFIDLARQMMPIPTAAFHEHFVLAAVEKFAHEIRGISCSRDEFGNVTLLYDGQPEGKHKRGFLLATAHLDHPGMGFPQRISKRNFSFEKLGGVDIAKVVDSTVKIYSPHLPVDQSPYKGKIISPIPSKGASPAKFKVRVEKSASSAITPQSFAVWDLPLFKRKGRFIHGRACDDLAGVAVGLAYLEEVSRRRLPIIAGLLLTRAEEIGFGGMLAAAQAKSLPNQALFVNIECSSSRAGAPLGNGPVIRVGDRWRIFDPFVTGGLVALAEELAAKNPNFCFQRKLMDGGICEATVLANAGFRTGAVALPLANYHNAGKKKLKAEIVHLDDALNLIALLVHLASHSSNIDQTLNQAQKHLEKRLVTHHHLVESRLST